MASVAAPQQPEIGLCALVWLSSTSLVGRTYRLVRHNLAEIQDIREEASLIFRMEDGEGIGLLDQAA